MEDTQVRTKFIETLMDAAREAYEQGEKKAAEITGDEHAMRQIEKGLWLRAIDTLWVEHLDAIEHVRRGIGLRAYGQQEPLIAYKKEAYRMFQELQHLIEKQVVYGIFKVGMATQTAAPSLLGRRGMQLFAPAKTMERGKNDVAAGLQPAQSGAPSEPKVGRNDPCYCGSGKKFKKCHGA
ncbi:MAG: SEC-C metal-binding domain-containing protein [bacterium]|nr:SEC-C metal-binding domain-containing protein [bacterium]